MTQCVTRRLWCGSCEKYGIGKFDVFDENPIANTVQGGRYVAFDGKKWSFLEEEKEILTALNSAHQFSNTYYVHRRSTHFDHDAGLHCDLFYIFVCNKCLKRGKKFYLGRIVQWELKKGELHSDTAAHRLDSLNWRLKGKLEVIQKMSDEKKFLEDWLKNIKNY